MDQITTDVRHNNWAMIISECNSSGISKAEWCRQNNVSVKSLYYYQKKLRNEAYKDISNMQRFAEINNSYTEMPTVHPAASAVLRVGDSYIEINDSASEGFLTRMIEAIRHAT